MNYLGKTTLGVFALALMFTALPAHAETATSTSALTSQLQALLKQVADLQAQMEKLNKQRAELTKDIITTRIALTKNLREGMTDDEVKVLQELLAMDPTIYPEGLVTGYFGPLTTKALKRFQEKHGIESVGEVGPKTLAKLNEEVSKGAWKAGNLPPGIAKKFSSTTAEMLPPGIYKKFIEQFWSKKLEDKEDEDEDDDDDNATSTLSIEDVEVDETGATSARVKWHTDMKSTGTLFYGTDDSLDTDATTTLKKTSSSKKSHDIRLTGLEEDETYYFIIMAEAGDDEVESDQFSFTMDGEDEEDLEDEEDDEDDDDDEDEDEDDDEEEDDDEDDDD